MRVGGRPAEGLSEFVHRRPMLSLDNSYNIEDLRRFDERCQSRVSGLSWLSSYVFFTRAA